MKMNEVCNFKGQALEEEQLQAQAPSIFASRPMLGVSKRYTFVPTVQIVSGLRQMDWVPVSVQEQRIRKETKRGFQKHMICFRRSEQMESLDEWNVELVLVNSHDAACAYQMHAGLFRRICSNGLVLSEGSFEAIRFRHAGLEAEEVIQASLRLLEFIPRVGELIHEFRQKPLEGGDAVGFAAKALCLRYSNVPEAPILQETLLKPRRVEDEGRDLWSTMNRVQENLIRGGVSDWQVDRRGHLRKVRPLNAIDAKVSLNKALWSLSEQVLEGERFDPFTGISLSA